MCCRITVADCSVIVIAFVISITVGVVVIISLGTTWECLISLAGAEKQLSCTRKLAGVQLQQRLSAKLPS